MDFKTGLMNYSQDLSSSLAQTDFALLSEIAKVLVNVKQMGGHIYTAGNGGSASTASHMCNDLTKGCRVYNREGFSCTCLADSLAVITCLANDFSYDQVFSIQLRTKAKKDDVLIVFSGSGNSPNIISAVETAKQMGVTTVGFTGRDGGKLKDLCDYLLIAPTESMERIEDLHLIYEHALVSVIREHLADAWGAEIVRYPSGLGISAALFDFDGTISLIREGWQAIMIPYFIEVLSGTPRAGKEEEVAACVQDFVDKLTGKQTIFQCIQLADEVKARGGQPLEPLEYKKEYLRRLFVHIENRLRGLENGNIDKADYLVPGVVELLTALNEAGIKCYLASGTDEADVLREAKLLGIDGFFHGRIYGARDEITDCSKELVIKKIIEDNKISGQRLVSFGDGYVEIELVKNIGGYTFGVASDEKRRMGIDTWKRSRLLSAGADCIIPDFSDPEKIIQLIRR